MRFTKYHGLGNDFVVVDLRAGGDDAVQQPAVVKALCDRQFGIGADGVLAILAGDAGADARMRVLNADGSEAEMCGNGIRCVAKELYERGGVHRDRLAIDTGAGRLACAIDADAGVVRSVTVAMGAPRLLRGEIPMTGPAIERCIEQPIELPGQPPRNVTGVSMGNPHAVTFVTDDVRALAEAVGPVIEHHPWFPRKTNVELTRVIGPRELELVVWERGVGITLACGTGACAAVVAAVITGRCEEASEVVVHLPGGALTILVERGLTDVQMRGPAVRVFDGEIDLRQLTARP